MLRPWMLRLTVIPTSTTCNRKSCDSLSEVLAGIPQSRHGLPVPLTQALSTKFWVMLGPLVRPDVAGCAMLLLFEI